SWRIRRAQHLIQHFAMSLRFREVPSKFRRILLIEGYLHLVNPWLLVVAAIMLLFALLHHSIIAVVALTLGLMLLTFKPYRTWIITQLCLIIGAIRNLYTKEIIWTKQVK
ncbi:MAG: glycosyltransferase family 2 protein, partial [Nitrososphaerota archaeon]